MSDEDLDRDAQSFMSFAAALGVPAQAGAGTKSALPSGAMSEAVGADS